MVNELIDQGEGELIGDSAEFNLTSMGLMSGSYQLEVIAVDDCENEGSCVYFFDVISATKPAPICPVLLTTVLTPWDANQDGLFDTVRAVVQARDFTTGIEPICQDTALNFGIEFILDNDTVVGPEAARDSLVLSCENLGTHRVRLWATSLPSNKSGYCVATLVVQGSSDSCHLESRDPDAGQIVEGSDESEQPIDGNQPRPQDQNSPPGVGGRPLKPSTWETSYASPIKIFPIHLQGRRSLALYCRKLNLPLFLFTMLLVG